MWDSFLLSNFSGLNWGKEKGGAEEICFVSQCVLRDQQYSSPRQSTTRQMCGVGSLFVLLIHRLSHTR